MLTQSLAAPQAAAPSAPETLSDTLSDPLRSGGGPLPHLDRIQASFGAHDVTGVRAHTGGEAASAAAEVGAKGYAVGQDVALASTDLHTVAHEAAHTIQQRPGVSLYGGFGGADPYEGHADAVADAVVAGRSAEGLLSAGPTGAAAAPMFKLGDGVDRPYAQLGRGERKALKDKPLKTYLLEDLDDSALTTSANTPAQEVRTALFQATPNAGQEAVVEGARRELNALWKGGKVTQADLNKLVIKTNLILDNSAVNAQHEWRLEAESGDVDVDQGGAAMWATVGVQDPDGDPDDPRQPKKLQVSLDRHMARRLKANSQTKALNSMLAYDVFEAHVNDDMAAIGADYKARYERGDKDNYLARPAGGRHYWVERLHAVEPHIYPKEGAQVVPLNLAEHTVIKAVVDAVAKKDKTHQTWSTVGALITAQGLTAAQVKTKLEALSVPVPKSIADAAT